MSEIDLSLLHLVNGWSGIWQLDRAVGFAAANTFFKGAIFMGAYWWFWFLPGPQARRRSEIISALLATMAALTIARLLALGLPFRSRPLYTAGIDFHYPTISATSQDLGFENWSSFPSDHAAMFFALACGLWRLSRPAGTLAILFATVWVCLPRLYLGIHYPTDLIAGAALGALCVYIAARLNIKRMVAAVLKFEHEYQPAFYTAMFLVTYEIAALFVDMRELMHGLLAATKTAGLKLSEVCAVTLGVTVLSVLVLKAIISVVGRLRRTPSGSELAANLPTPNARSAQ